MPRRTSKLKEPPAPGRWAKTSEIVLDSDFRTLVPQPDLDERAELLESLGRDGCVEPLIVWRWNGRCILLVGYRLFPLLQKHCLPFRVIEKVFLDRAEARQFIIKYLLARNVLTPLALCYYRGVRYHDEKQERGGDHKSPDYQEIRVGKKTTDVALAEIYHVTPAIIRRDAAFAQAVDQLVVVGGSGIKPLLFGGEARITRQAVVEFGKRQLRVQQHLLERLCATKRLPRLPGKKGQRQTVTLPLKPGTFAETLRRRVSPRRFTAILKALLRERKKPAPEPKPVRCLF